MILYVILFFIALCIGMATSVYAFGTGGKRKKIFEDIYFSVEEVDGIGVVYSIPIRASVLVNMENVSCSRFAHRRRVRVSHTIPSRNSSAE